MIRLGTSGFSYPDWKHLLYEGVPQRKWLEHYAQVFRTVELNATFYRLPAEKTVDRWREETPGGFLFACKGSRYLTHMKRLTDEGPGIRRFFDKVDRLKQKLGPILWQLPPTLKKANLELLESYLSRLPKGRRHVFEFRAEDWYREEVCRVLDRHGAAFCEHDLVGRLPPRTTGGFRYIRFHGAGARYSGRYKKKALEPWARDLESWSAQGRDAFVYFNNDQFGHALMDALDFSELLDQPVPLELHA
jgi:uncharacterized protein YecE (DUF72 family)